MKVHLNQAGVISIIAAAALSIASLSVQASDRIEQTYVKENFTTAYKSSMMIGDVPNHEVGQELTVADIKYSNPRFKSRRTWGYNQFDYVNGSGPQRGTFFDAHSDGNQTYGTYEGTQKTVVNPDGSWEATWEGKYRYSGGSGKYKNIEGTGTYHGSASSKDAAREEGREVIEY